MTEQNKKGFFSKLFSGKLKQGGCCNVQFEEVSDDNDKNENTDKEDKKPDKTSLDKKSTNSDGCCCG